MIVPNTSPNMGFHLWPRDVITEGQNQVDSVQNTFSSWDSCMQKDYCKWPVYSAIIVGSLIALSLLWCLARCIFCGASCCCGCLSCCNACCPSGGGRRSKGHQPLQQAPPPMPFHAQNTQYQSHAQPMYRGPATATFDVSNGKTEHGKVNEDSLPAMPTWGNAVSRKVETQAPQEDVEMNRLDSSGAAAGASAPLIANAQPAPVRSPTGPGAMPGYASPVVSLYAEQRHDDFGRNGDMGMQHVSPYHDQGRWDEQDQYGHQGAYNDPYNARNPNLPSYPQQSGVMAPAGARQMSPLNTRRQQSPLNSQYTGRSAPPRYQSPTYEQSPYQAENHNNYNNNAAHGYPPSFAQTESTMYEPPRGGYEPSVAPSYHTEAPIQQVQRKPTYPGQRSYTPVNEGRQQQPLMGAGNRGSVGRKPVNGSWRDI